MKKLAHIGVLFLILLPLLTGCFQQAGEAFQPADSTGVPITLPDSTDTPLPLDPNTIDAGATDIPELTSFPATATVPGVNQIDITIISPTRNIGATATPPSLPPTTTGEDSPTTEAQVFRTPVSPLGPVTPDTPVPVGPSGSTSATPSGLITPTALPGIGSDPAAADCTHTVQRGETLFRIALANNTTVNDIVAANPGINPNLIQPGQVITLPGCVPGVSPDVPAPTTPEETVVESPDGAVTTYIVQRGDTLFAIAQRFGVTVQAIVNANNLSNPNNLDVGQRLIIPPSS